MQSVHSGNEINMEKYWSEHNNHSKKTQSEQNFSSKLVNVFEWFKKEYKKYEEKGKGTIFITIIKSSLNKKNMRNGLHLSHDGISLLNNLMIVNETLTSFLINPAILADIK